MISPEHYTMALEQALRDITERLKSALDPVQKEKRTFPVIPSNELCREIASVLIELGFDNFPGRDQYVYGFTNRSGMTTRWRNYADFRVPSSDASKIYMAPIYYVLGPLSAERDDARSTQLLTVKISTLTRIDGISMREHISNILGDVNRNQPNRIVTFVDVVRHTDTVLYDQLFGNSKGVSKSFLDTITKMALEGNYQNKDIIEKVRQLAIDFPRQTKLRLQTKTYIARADIRAYYVDKDPIRHLSASIFQSIIQGPKGYIQGFNVINQILPPKGKNIVNWTLKVDSHEILQIVTGDVSSFTNSNVNTWIMALAMYHRLLLKDVEQLNSPILANIAGTVLEFTILDVLRSFLYQTVGATAKIGDETFVAPGGYLGVKANMRLTCLSFVACLYEIESKVLHMFDVKFISQIGGDDFILALIGTPDNVSRATGYTYEQITRYVGSLKEFTAETINLQPVNESHTNLVFCKKILAWTRLEEPGYFRLYSVRKLPIMSQLVEHVSMRMKDRVKDFLSFRSGVIDTLKTIENHMIFVSAYEYAYRRFHNFQRSVVSSRFVDHITETDLVEFGGNSVTRSIQRRLQLMGPYRSSAGNIYLNERDLISLLSFDARVKTVKDVIMDNGLLRQIICYKNENPISRLEQTREILTDEETELGRVINHIFQQFRNDISFLQEF